MAVSAADKKKLGKWIKQAREKKQPHLSQRQLALAVDITNASLSSIESGMIFPSEELLLKLIEQLQPPPELREKMLTLFAKAKGTSPPDINAELSKNPKLWGLIRQLIAVDPSEEAKETYYDGYRFRSRLEARWAVFFNNIGLEYEYEMEGFDMKNVLTCLTSISHLLTDGLRSKASR